MTESNISDMKRRVRNHSPCNVRFEMVKPSCWSYGELMFSYNEGDGVQATFGDLTVVVNVEQMLELSSLATSSPGRAWLSPDRVWQ